LQCLNEQLETAGSNEADLGRIMTSASVDFLSGRMLTGCQEWFADERHADGKGRVTFPTRSDANRSAAAGANTSSDANFAAELWAGAADFLSKYSGSEKPDKSEQQIVAEKSTVALQLYKNANAMEELAAVEKDQEHKKTMINQAKAIKQQAHALQFG
jgi:hypothetical protein